MTYTRHNNLENLSLDYEHDDAYEGLEISEEELNIISSIKVVINGSTEVGTLEDCSYISVDPTYSGALSIGQRKLYEILLLLQESSVYSLTTIGKLAQSMGLEHPSACGKRLENLQSVGAISGLK